MARAGDGFSILGRPLVARVRTPSLASWLSRQWSFPEHALTPVPYAIHLEEVDAPPEPLVGTPVSVPLHRMTLSALAGDGGDVWYFGGERTGVRLRIGEAESHIAVWGVASGKDSGATFAALFVSVAESLRASGLLPLHAAVAVHGGRATALSGPSGVGKSTTLWRLMCSGWAPLAEDFAWLDPATRLVYGWDRGLRLWPETRERFVPEVPVEDFRTDADGKLFLAYERLPLPHSVVRSGTLARLAVLARGAESGADSGSEGGSESGVEGGATGHASGPLTALAPLSRPEAVRAWWETIGLPLSPAMRDRVAMEIATLVQRVDAVRLPLGPGPLPLRDG